MRIFILLLGFLAALPICASSQTLTSLLTTANQTSETHGNVYTIQLPEGYMPLSILDLAPAINSDRQNLWGSCGFGGYYAIRGSGTDQTVWLFEGVDVTDPDAARGCFICNKDTVMEDRIAARLPERKH